MNIVNNNIIIIIIITIITIIIIIIIIIIIHTISDAYSAVYPQVYYCVLM